MKYVKANRNLNKWISTLRDPFETTTPNGAIWKNIHQWLPYIIVTIQSFLVLFVIRKSI